MFMSKYFKSVYYRVLTFRRRKKKQNFCCLLSLLYFYDTGSETYYLKDSFTERNVNPGIEEADKNSYFSVCLSQKCNISLHIFHRKISFSMSSESKLGKNPSRKKNKEVTDRKTWC